jgi:uncharacterized protein YjbI with pentapeptide repeats
MKKTKFIRCRLTGTDFSSADLTEALFDNCELTNAVFSATILEKADLHTSTGIRLDPDVNRLRKARFSVSSLPGLLEKYGITIEG